jgi:hypothetical protein
MIAASVVGLQLPSQSQRLSIKYTIALRHTSIMSTNPASAFATLTLGTSPYHPYNLAYSHPQGAKLTAKEQMDARVQARLDYLHNNDKLNGREQPVKGANNGGKDAGHGKNQQAGKSASVGRVVDRVVVKMFEAIGKAGSFG